MLDTFTRHTLLGVCPTNCVRFTMRLIPNPILSLLFSIAYNTRWKSFNTELQSVFSDRLLSHLHAGFVSKDKSWPYFCSRCYYRYMLHRNIFAYVLTWSSERVRAKRRWKIGIKRTWMIFARTTFHPLDNGTSVYHAAASDAAHSARPTVGR